MLNYLISVYKKLLRRRKVAAREGLADEERAERSSRICRRIAGMAEFINARTVLVYNWTRGEVRLDDIRDLAVSQGKELLYPLCVSRTEMAAILPSRGDDAWKAGPFGILEPDPVKGELIEPENIDLVIAPCTSFDRYCRRLGMGGGYYDRYLPRCTKADVIAAAFEVQRSLMIPADEYDISVSAVVTEERILRR